MGLNPQGYFWLLGGAYFVLAGLDLLPLPRNIRAWFDAAGRDRYRKGLRAVGPVFFITGVAILFRIL